eukprot:1529785-Prymnesium_polylepis.1
MREEGLDDGYLWAGLTKMAAALLGGAPPRHLRLSASLAVTHPLLGLSSPSLTLSSPSPRPLPPTLAL